MKLNKTLMIAALVASGMFAADSTSRAQDSTNTPPAGARPPGGPGARNLGSFDRIAIELALTEEQKTKVKPVFDEMMQKNADLRKDTSVQGTARRDKMLEFRNDATTKLKDILTPIQLDKWQKMTPGNRRPPGGAGAPPAATPPAGDAKSQ